MHNCQICKGKKTVKCSACEVKVRIRGNTFLDIGAPDCPFCKGYGIVSCPNCQGAGYVYL